MFSSANYPGLMRRHAEFVRGRISSLKPWELKAMKRSGELGFMKFMMPNEKGPLVNPALRAK
jgi:hypothetical protein